MNREGLVYTIIFTFVLGVLFVAALAAVELSTREQVEINARVAEYQAVLDALGKEPAAADNDQIITAFTKLFPQQEGQGRVAYPLNATIDGERVIVEPFKGKGLWGSISGVIAVNTAVDKIIGMTVVDHNETPGLGGRIVQPWFKDQFRGEKIGSKPFKVVLAKVPGGDVNHDNGQIDAIGGATLTSHYMEIIVNNVIGSLRQELKEGGSK